MIHAFKRLPCNEEYVNALFASSAAFLIGLPDMGAYKPELRHRLATSSLAVLDDDVFVAGMLSFAYDNKLELSLERIHQFAVIVALMHAVYHEATKALTT